ncbi:MAG: hypothetical protein Q9169_003433 [Polycauliona sp. 2 TL-2023]
MVGTGLAPLLHKGTRGDLRNYGTIKSDSLSMTESSVSHQEAGKLAGKRLRGGTSTVESLTWNNDRLSCADVYLDGVFKDPELNRAVVEAALLDCEHVGFAVMSITHSTQCRLVDKPYFNPVVPTQNQGRPRLTSRVRGATGTDKTETTVAVQGTSLNLTVDCPKLLAFHSRNAVPTEDNVPPLSARRGRDSTIGGLAPGFYVLWGRHLEESQSNKEEVLLRDRLGGENAPSASSVPTAATKPMQSPLSPSQHVACTLKTGQWARYCPRNWEVDVPSTNTLHGILRRAPPPNNTNPLKHPLLGLWVALGMLVFFSALALAGALARRYLARRTRFDAVRPVTSEEHEEASRDEMDTRPRHIRLLQRLQAACAWGVRSADRSAFKRSQPFGRKTIQDGSSPRKLQKMKGTRFEDLTELRPSVVPAASVVPVERPVDQTSSVEKDSKRVVGNDMDQGSAEQIGGTSTAQESKSRAATTRRSNRSTSVYCGDEDSP